MYILHQFRNNHYQSDKDPKINLEKIGKYLSSMKNLMIKLSANWIDRAQRRFGK